MAESWVFGANDPELGFGLNHLPFTAFVDPTSGRRRLAAGIGACLLDLVAAEDVAQFPSTMDEWMRQGPDAWAALRASLQYLLSRENKDRKVLEAALLPIAGTVLENPCAIRNYTDFYASRNHAMRVGEMFRPEKPLLENYDWVPIAYHGRASSVVSSPAAVRRPMGQIRGDVRPRFGLTERLDYELELGYFLGTENPLGEPVPVADADKRLFGLSLLNDWSARDIQSWEYQPLGPFLGKNFCTSVSPWVTPMAALEPFRCSAVAHPEGMLGYLQEAGQGVSLRLEVRLSTAKSRARGMADFTITRTDSAELYWTPAQMVAHHTSNGCNLLAGDLLGSGTVSGATREEAGCLLELTALAPFSLPNGEMRQFLEDGDEVTLVGWGEAAGEIPVRLGDCRGRVNVTPGSR